MVYDMSPNPVVVNNDKEEPLLEVIEELPQKDNLEDQEAENPMDTSEPLGTICNDVNSTRANGGTGWDTWGPGVTGSWDTSTSGDAMRLPREDMKIFGEFPAWDDFVLVSCETCHRSVKAEAFEEHCRQRHNYASPEAIGKSREEVLEDAGTDREELAPDNSNSTLETRDSSVAQQQLKPMRLSRCCTCLQYIKAEDFEKHCKKQHGNSSSNLINNQRSEERKVDRERNAPQDRDRKVPRDSLKNNSVDSSSRREAKPTSPPRKLWYDGTVYKCGLCQLRFKDRDSITKHLTTGHKKKSTSTTYKDSIILVSQSFYTCKVCETEVARNRQAIRNHVRGSHKLTFLQYESSQEADSITVQAEERVDVDENRTYSHSLVGRKIRGLYEEGWCEGVIDYFNTRLGQYHIHFPESGEDYVTESDIDGVGMVLIEE